MWKDRQNFNHTKRRRTSQTTTYIKQMKKQKQTPLQNFAIAIAAVLSFGVGLPQASAITVTVKNLNNSGSNSLRSAITAVNASTDASNTINFQAGLDGIIKLDSALPEISKSVSINGPSAEKIKIRGGNGGVFNVVFGIVDISGLTLEGKGRDAGAVVRNQFASLTINECVITGKRPGNQTGLVNEISGQTLIVSSAIVNNDNRGCGTNGGGIRNDGQLTLINSTVAENTAVKGGAIYNSVDGTVSLTNCTLADNKVSDIGGGIFNANSVSLGNTIVARNMKQTSSNDDDNDDDQDDDDEVASSSNDVNGIFTSRGDNLIGTTAGSTGFGGTDIVNVANSLLKFGANVADNGGTTPTLALLTGSPAINAGNNALAVDQNGEPLAFDQRGSPFTRINGGTVEIGAFEVQSPAPLSSARAYKQRALKTVSETLCNVPGLSNADKFNLRWASCRTAASLEHWLWLSGNELSRYGFFAFEREKQAVWYLAKVTTGPGATAAQSAIADLLEADNIIALTSLNAASSTP
ncbi:MAG: hypothetical protein IAG10_30165, partial [Planctomycetaceae bacterium]|nr:hypothetical protein [Planctomycetaceae bacterium]